MSTDTGHADRVYAVARQNSAAANSPIAASWRRCMTMHRLAPEDERSPLHLGAQEFHEVRQRSEHLIAETREELDRLFLTVGKAGCCLLLTDENGVALDRRGAIGDDDDFRRLGLWPGNVWSEASVGTNGIGTALADERTVTIYRDQHFLSTNTQLSCATAPVRDHLGRVAGAIDISTCRKDAHEMVVSILLQAVKDAASRVEANLFRNAFPGARFLMVPVGASSSLALLAVDCDDLVIGATRGARLALGIDDARIALGIPASDALKEVSPAEGDDLADAERAALRRVLSRTNGNVSQAALMLGISRATMHRKMKRLALH